MSSSHFHYFIHNQSSFERSTIIPCRSPGHMFAETYVPTQLRFSSWLVGLIFGAIMRESRKRNIRIPMVSGDILISQLIDFAFNDHFFFKSKKINLVAWLLTLGLMATVIFANYPLAQSDIKTTNINHALYDSLSRIAWALALSYIIFACAHGYGGPLNWFLSLSLWQPLSRLSYAIYILHFHVSFIVMASAKSSFVLSEFHAVSPILFHPITIVRPIFTFVN